MPRYNGEQNARECLSAEICRIFRDNKKKTEGKKGIRQVVLETYHSKGILEAYKVLEEYNKRIGYAIYTREMFEKWIAEEREKEDMRKYDGFDR